MSQHQETILLKKVKVTPVYEANLRAYQQGWPIICNEGGSRCFHADTKVHTVNGPKSISEIQLGDVVLTPNGSKPVIDVFVNHNTKRCIKVKLKNGNTIIATEDHKFMFRQRWNELKNIVSLWNENNTKL